LKKGVDMDHKIGRPLLSDKPLSSAERKRRQRANAKSHESHESHERNYRAEAVQWLETVGSKNWTNELRKYVIAEFITSIAKEENLTKEVALSLLEL
jgi:hypothetical protein